MDLPAFALHAEPLRRKSYPPKPVLVSLVHLIGFGVLYSFASFALACAYFVRAGCIRCEQALLRPYLRQIYFGANFICGKRVLTRFALELAGYV